MMTAPRLRPGDRVLVTRLDYLGDAVLSLPLVDALASSFPGIEIDYLARPPGADLLTGDPRLGRVFALEAGFFAGVRLARVLRARGYRAVIDLYSNPRSAWLSWLSGAPIRVGGRRRGRRHLYTHAVSVPPATRSVIDVFLAYGAPLGANVDPRKPSLAILPEEARSAEETLAAAGAAAGRMRIGVHPGGKWDVKRWPAARFAELIRLARERAGVEIVLLTGPGEAEATEAVRTLCPESVRVVPALGVRAVAALISRLDAFVACDGGVMHVAVAVGTPTVGVFGSSEREVWFPYESFGPFRAAVIDVPCRPCHRHVCPLGTTACLNDLGAQAVWTEMERVLAAAGASRRTLA